MTETMMEKEKVVLVSPKDEPLGTEEKLKAHQLGLLHRAFSVFIYRTGGENRGEELEFLLQKRHNEKYHCGGLWTNTCCSHPRLNETVISAAERRLKEEMSLSISLHHAGSFIYRAAFENGLIEHEFDHVFLGEFKESDNPQTIKIDPKEVQEYRWLSLPLLENELSNYPETFTPWMRPAFAIAMEYLWNK
jgi:isopentenyl-diphosphate delta-isomerase